MNSICPFISLQLERATQHPFDTSKIRKKKSYNNKLIFYFMDNIASYFILASTSSKIADLHELILQIKLLELHLEIRLIVVHVPGTYMITQGTDGLSRGLWISPARTNHETSATFNVFFLLFCI